MNSKRTVSRRGFLTACGALAATATLSPLPAWSSILEGTRTLSLFNQNTGERIIAMYMRGGEYDHEALARLNRFLRDWRTGDQIDIDTDLFNILHHLQKVAGNRDPVHVVSGYRSPETNAMLRKHTDGVARNSFHMYGRAIDLRIPGTSLNHLRKEAVKLKAGGVGYYRKSHFIHVDSGTCRTWSG